MKVLGLSVFLRLFEIHSLKEKRSIRQRLIKRLCNKFNVSVAEVENMDELNLLTIGIVTVSNDYKHLEMVEASIKNFIESFCEFEVINYERFIL